MSTISYVENGQITDTSTISSSSSSTGMDKDAFLQLLVAQMKYQDPLEPTSNTEYISQYAQFSQVEQMQNLADTSELARATSLVGQTVYITTTSTSGVETTISGNVDYVVFENGKPLVSVDDTLYSLDDVETVVDMAYVEAVNKAYNFVVTLNQLPSVSATDSSNIEELQSLKEMYEAMSSYDLTFVATEVVTTYETYMEKLEALLAAGDTETDTDVDVDTETPEIGGEADETAE